MKSEEFNIIGLIEGCKKNDRKSQHIIYNEFYGKMMGVALRYFRDQDTASDVVQESFIKAFSKIYNTKNNPTEGFIGLMCYPEADQECPVIFGAKKRSPLYYIDPKFADGKLS